MAKADMELHVPVKLDVTVEDVDLSTVVGEQRVWIDEEDGGWWETHPQTLGQAIVAEYVRAMVAADSGLKKAIRDVRREVIADMVRDEVRKALEEPFQPTTQYGEPVGEPMTLRGVIVAEAQKALTVRTDRGQYGKQQTVGEKAVADAVNAAFVKELQATLEAEKKKVVAAMQAQAADVIAKVLAAGVGVR